MVLEVLLFGSMLFWCFKKSHSTLNSTETEKPSQRFDKGERNGALGLKKHTYVNTHTCVHVCLLTYICIYVCIYISLLQCRRHGFDPWVGKILWRRKCQPTSVFLPGESHGQMSLVGYTVHGVSRVRHDLATQPSPPPPYKIYIIYNHTCTHMLT